MFNKVNILLAGAVALGGFAAAPALAVTDVIQAPTGYFVPTDAQKYDFPYYRGAGNDWSWTHNAIAAGFTTATLTISAFDVDSPYEIDEIYAKDNGSWTLLGALTGSNNQWEYGNTFTLGSNYFDDISSGLEVMVHIDAGNGGWVVTLGKSVLITDGGVLPPPTPGVPEPAAWALMIAGFGMVGAAARRRRTSFVAA